MGMGKVMDAVAKISLILEAGLEVAILLHFTHPKNVKQVQKCETKHITRLEYETKLEEKSQVEDEQGNKDDIG